MRRKLWLLSAFCLLPACIGGPSGGGPIKSAITVFAAASLQPAFDKMATPLAEGDGIGIQFSYAGTQTLTTQITQGAPADVFASADAAHVTTLNNAGLVQESQLFAHNRLDIVVAKGNPQGIHSLADLGRRDLVIVLADPSVPAGKYAQQALAKAKVTVHPASLELQVTGVLSKVALGEADAGIVYHSDIVTSGKVDGVAIPDAQNVIADYPIAVLKAAKNQAGATAFVNFVLSANGQAILKAAGFEGV